MAKYIKKGNKEYAMLMIPSEVHQILKEYCTKHHFIMSGFVSALVKQHIYGKKK